MQPLPTGSGQSAHFPLRGTRSNVPGAGAWQKKKQKGGWDVGGRGAAGTEFRSPRQAVGKCQGHGVNKPLPPPPPLPHSQIHCKPSEKISCDVSRVCVCERECVCGGGGIRLKTSSSPYDFIPHLHRLKELIVFGRTKRIFSRLGSKMFPLAAPSAPSLKRQ